MPLCVLQKWKLELGSFLGFLSGSYGDCPGVLNPAFRETLDSPCGDKGGKGTPSICRDQAMNVQAISVCGVAGQGAQGWNHLSGLTGGKRREHRENISHVFDSVIRFISQVR